MVNSRKRNLCYSFFELASGPHESANMESMYFQSIVV